MICPKCSSPNIHQGQMGSMKCYACGYMESAKAAIHDAMIYGTGLIVQGKDGVKHIPLSDVYKGPTPPPDWQDVVDGKAHECADKHSAIWKDDDTHSAWEIASHVAYESYLAGHAFARGEVEALTEECNRLRVAYDERGAAMRETGDMVRSLYVGSEVSKRILSLREENARLREALERILHLGNMAAQGHWDDTHVMKNIAYDALNGWANE